MAYIITFVIGGACGWYICSKIDAIWRFLDRGSEDENADKE